MSGYAQPELPGEEELATCGESVRGNHVGDKRLRVLYSFPNPLGGPRIGYTAWQQVRGLARAGVDLTVCSASVRRPVPPTVRLWRTLSWGKVRVPFKLIGRMRGDTVFDAGIEYGDWRHHGYCAEDHS